MITKVLGIVLIAVPFLFAGIRLRATGDDMRYLWMAVAATLCAAGVLFRSNPPTAPSGARTAVTAIAGAVCAATVAMLLGATAASGVAIVALTFGLCSTLGITLVVRSVRKEPR